jgi:hypothetical protein
MKHLKTFNENSIEEIDAYFNRPRSYSDKVGSDLYNHKDSDYWEYLGEPNGGEWSINLSDLLDKVTYRPMDESEKIKISELLLEHLSKEKSGKVWNPKTKSYEDWVVYPTLTEVRNFRFENCWFLQKDKDWSKMEFGWNIFIQGFDDEWYLVNVGDGRGYYNYWFRVDTFKGLIKFIQNYFIDVK